VPADKQVVIPRRLCGRLALFAVLLTAGFLCLALRDPGAALGAGAHPSPSARAQHGHRVHACPRHRRRDSHGHCRPRRHPARTTSAAGPAAGSAAEAGAQPAPAAAVPTGSSNGSTPTAAQPAPPTPVATATREEEEEAPEEGPRTTAPTEPEGPQTTAPAESESPPETPPAPEEGSLPVLGSVGPAPLEWAPPELHDPITVRLGTGYTHTSLSTSRDYIVELPPTKKIGATWIDGGHNVVIVGGSITIPTGTTPGVAYDAQRNGIYIKGATGTVHIEGVLIDGSGGAEFDGVDINAPEATVQLENMRIEGVRGTFSGFHGDAVQPWGGVADLRIDRMSATSNYQGLTLQQDLGPIGSAELSEVDLTGTTEAPLDKGGHLLWLTKGSNTCTAFPVQLSDVFVSPRPGLSLGTSVWPATNSRLACDDTGVGFAAWPTLPVLGGVLEGPPPGGAYVPPGTVGLDYESPGYLG
jgi:hypothetical protein